MTHSPSEAVAANIIPTRERIWVGLLAAIQFTHILDFVIMMPLGPMFMRTFNVTPAQFGILVSSYTFSAGIANFIISIYADIFERKKMLITCFIGFLVGTFLCALANGYEFLLMARIFAGAFGGVLNAVLFALVSDLIPAERRGTATGVIMSSFSIASVIGVPIGLILAETFNWHAPFLFIVAFGIIIALAAAYYLPAINNKVAVKPVKETLIAFGKIATEPNHIRGFLLTVFLSFGVFLIVPFMPPYMVRNVGLLESDLKYIYLCGGAGTVISARIIGKLCDKLGSYRMFSTLIVISFIPLILLTNLPQVPIYWALTVSTMFMMFVSGRFIPAMTLVSLVVEPKKRGTFMGLESAFRQLASGASSLIAGVIIIEQADGKLDRFWLVGIIAIATSIAAFVMARILKNRFNLR